MRYWISNFKISFLFFIIPWMLMGQEKNDSLINGLPLHVDYMSHRPAKWEENSVHEYVNEKRNQGGLLFVYYTNQSDKPVSLREWYFNDRESGHYRLAGDIAWDRRYSEVVAPGQTAVQEICGVSPDFQTGKKADFSIVGSQWQPVCNYQGTLETEKWRITSIVFDSTLAEIWIHIKSFVPQTANIVSVSCSGKKTDSLKLSDSVLDGYGHVIAHLSLDKPFNIGELAIIKFEIRLGEKTENIYSHRNAYIDYFPNGTWGIEVGQYQDARRHHLNTMVRGGNSMDGFFSSDYKTTGFRAMPHTGLYPNVDMLRDLEKHPAVACWYIHDEPDWLYTPQLVLTSHEMTKKYSDKKPTLITLCRNVKFFEYAFIPDIPCHDHYSVSAPSSSKWPYVYGTRLEETAFYTADLKYASEPKPIWVWSQGVHLWDERPKMPLPTPDELGAQLYFNLGRGAKGNLWFTFMEEAGRRYPATKMALRNYSRVVRLLEKDLLVSDPWQGNIKAPELIDVACLLTADKVILFITNKDYLIHDAAYQWNPYQNLNINLTIPSWFTAKEAFEIDPDSGIQPVKWAQDNKVLNLQIDNLHMGKVLVFSRLKMIKDQYKSNFNTLISAESKP